MVSHKEDETHCIQLWLNDDDWRLTKAVAIEMAVNVRTKAYRQLMDEKIESLGLRKKKPKLKARTAKTTGQASSRTKTKRPKTKRPKTKRPKTTATTSTKKIRRRNASPKVVKKQS